MKKIIFIIFIAASYLSLSLPAYSKTFIMVDSKIQFQLAESLFTEKHFLAAANEYLRFMHLFPDDKKAEQAGYKAGLAYFKANQYQEAKKIFQNIIRQLPNSVFGVKAVFKLSELYNIINKPGMSVATLKNIIVITKDTKVRDTACFMLGWLLTDRSEELKAGSDYKIYPLKEAEKYFSMISIKGKQNYKINYILSELSKRNLVKKKNPVLAGILSIIPGGGFLYCGRYQDAFVSFLLNSSLMIATHQAFNNDNVMLGGVIAFVETGFYSGNIYGGIASAHKFNKNRREEFIHKLKQSYRKKTVRLTFKPVFSENGIAMTCSYRF